MGLWIKNFKQDAAGEWNRVDGFLTGERVVCVTTHPTDGGLYYVRWPDKVRTHPLRPRRQPSSHGRGHARVSFGPAPLTVQFNGSASSDPEGQPLQYLWAFGDGGAQSNQPVPPARVFTAPDSNPRRFDVTLRVTDGASATNEKQVLVSVNNTPPAVEITSPLPGTLYSMTQDEVHVLSADISDLEHGPGSSRARGSSRYTTTTTSTQSRWTPIARPWPPLLPWGATATPTSSAPPSP